MRECSVRGCERSQWSRGWCHRHYAKWYKHGDPEWMKPTQAERLRAVTDRNGPIPEYAPELGPCWLFTARRNRKGYGLMWHSGLRRGVVAHRISYELYVGTIPDGLQLDHLCRVRHCVNPNHLEPVTPSVNTLRGNLAAVTRARAEARTHCANGHELTTENTNTARGWRECRSCQRDRRARRTARIRDGEAAAVTRRGRAG